MKPHSAACDQNREPILAVLEQEFRDCRRVLEIGSGTGQHAAYFPRRLPHLVWQSSDLASNLAGIRAWIDEAGLANAPPPLELDVKAPDWKAGEFDGLFSANTVHIMDWEGVQALFAGAGRVLVPGGVFALYGPFNYGGRYSSESNAHFDAWLRQRDPASGIRDFDDLARLADAAGLALRKDYPMPVNNRTLVWRKAQDEPHEPDPYYPANFEEGSHGATKARR